MIRVTKLNGSPIHINAELIETIAATPDTVITLTNGNKVIVEESVDQVVDEIIRYHRLINRRAVIVRNWADRVCDSYDSSTTSRSSDPDDCDASGRRRGR